MLTIGQLASYAGLTVRAVRHYHQVGLLAEPERDHSGYRTYDAEAVVRLIRIRTLAQAGVPLSRVRELLDADTETFASATREIDRQLRAQVRELQEHRRRIARLGSGDALAVPDVVTDYHERLRALGVPAALLDAERGAWILMAARWPDTIADMMADKVAQLEDPDVVTLYRLLGQMSEIRDDTDDEQLLTEIADLLSRLFERAAATGDLDRQFDITPDEQYIALMDSFADDAHPAVRRLRELVAERGWVGWTRVARGTT